MNRRRGDANKLDGKTVQTFDTSCNGTRSYSRASHLNHLDGSGGGGETNVRAVRLFDFAASSFFFSVCRPAVSLTPTLLLFISRCPALSVDGQRRDSLTVPPLPKHHHRYRCEVFINRRRSDIQTRGFAAGCEWRIR